MTDDVEIISTLPPLHPGEILREEFLFPLSLSARALAKACGVPNSRIERIVAERVAITGDIAIRLGRVLGTGPEFWMNLQARFEIETAKVALAGTIDRLVPLNSAARAAHPVARMQKLAWPCDSIVR